MDKVQFFYAIKSITQLGFDGRNYTEELPVGFGHIIVNDMILCGKTKDKIKRESDTKRHTTRMSRFFGLELCKECEKRYKENPRFAWKKWENTVNDK